MAVTVTTAPAAHVAAWGVVKVEGTSNALTTAGRENLRMKITITVGAETVIYYEPTKYVSVLAYGFTTNIAPALRGFLSSPIDVWPTTITPGNCAIEYSLTIQELYDVSGVATLGEGSTVTGYIAHRAADIAGRILTTGADAYSLQDGVIQRVVPDNIRLPLDVISTATGTLITSEDEAVTVTNNRMSSFELLTFGTNAVITYYGYIDGTARKTNPIVYRLDSKCYQRDLVLYWLNRHGGYEVYHWIDSEAVNHEGESINFEFMDWDGIPVKKRLPSRNIEKIQLIGRMETEDTAAYLKDLVTSPEVFDADGNKVYVVSGSMDVYRDGEFRPTVTIIKEIHPCIGY